MSPKMSCGECSTWASATARSSILARSRKPIWRLGRSCRRDRCPRQRPGNEPAGAARRGSAGRRGRLQQHEGARARPRCESRNRGRRLPHRRIRLAGAPRRGAGGVAFRAWRRACRPRRFHAAADRAVSRALPGPDPERAPVAAACIPGSARGRGRARARGQGHRGNRALRRRWGRYRPNRAAGGGCGSERRHRRNAARADPGGRAPAAARCGPTLPRRQAELAGGPRVIKRALISVYDKSGLDEFAQGLTDPAAGTVSSGGTSRHLEEMGIPVTRIEEITQVPELLGGRVKTLHPRIHAAILARRDEPEDLSALEEQEIQPLDLVCVNLYPFRETVAKHGVREEDAVEVIDIGGPAMLRAAAKNFAHVAPVCRGPQYERVLEELRRDGELSLETRRELAAEAFSVTAAYEASIAGWFMDRLTFPDRLIPAFEKVADLSYGENPHQRAAYYAELGARRHLLSQVEQLHGRELSYNNLNDLNAARLCLREFELPACVIVKHANPCGVSVAGSIEHAYERALAADPVAPYGGVVILNRLVSEELADLLVGQFVEVLFAPGYDEAALETLMQKPATRILVDRERRRGAPGERDFKRVLGGLLVQDRDWDIEDRAGMEVVSGEATETLWGDILFAWRVSKHVTSNAIMLARDLQTLGIGAGQMSSVHSVRIAVEKAREHVHDLEGAVLASDAFFPFADGPELALRAGVSA